MNVRNAAFESRQPLPFDSVSFVEEARGRAEVSMSRDSGSSSADHALRRIAAEIVDGLRHGYFSSA